LKVPIGLDRLFSKHCKIGIHFVIAGYVWWDKYRERLPGLFGGFKMI
jgi:hypothetical protein